MSKKIFDIGIKDFQKIGQGVEGSVYLAPGQRVLKVYRSPTRCKSEYKILKEMEGSPFFPKVQECRGRYMLREYVDGTPIVRYIRNKGLSAKLADNLISLAEVFDQHGNIKLDGIDKHIFVLADERVMVIDPRRKKYRLYQRLLRAMKKLEVYDSFVTLIKEKKPELVSKWQLQE